MMTDVDYILSHFEELIFPREIMTAISSGKFSVNSKEEIYEKRKEAKFIDCRINAYPIHTEFKGLVRYPPNFVFIDQIYQISKIQMHLIELKKIP